MAEFVLRAATEPDLAAVRDLLVATWHATYDGIYGRERVREITDRWHSLAALARGAAGPRRVFLVAERDGRIVGTSLAYPDGCEAVLSRLYVHPEAQGTGLGRRILDESLRRLIGASACRLEVEPRNVRAIRFYERAGFAPAGESRNCGGDSGYEALIMRRELGSGAAPVLVLREATDRDAQDLFGLLALCFAEHPGCYVDPHEDLTDLRAPGRSFAARDGAFWVVEDERGRICACVAVDYPEPQQAELHRLYVRPDRRRRGLGERLVRLTEDHAREHGATSLFFWSDTRFAPAHRLYERLGYRRAPDTRELGDISGSVEYRFDKKL
jgi:ribosomal protein S18 acetylase RimI-like enzyme